MEGVKMTMQQAIESGRPFRRKCWEPATGYIIIDSYRVFAWEDHFDPVGHHTDFIPTPEDVMATDWEIRSADVLM